MTCTATAAIMLYKQRLQRTGKEEAEQSKAATSNQSVLLATTGSSPKQQRDYLKTPQRYCAVQTDRAMTDDVMDLFDAQGLLL
jgi:hypothetical protein